ncbi:unnamed protein product [Closterium sp. NIES-54]
MALELHLATPGAAVAARAAGAAVAVGAAVAAAATGATVAVVAVVTAVAARTGQCSPVVGRAGARRQRRRGRYSGRAVLRPRQGSPRQLLQGGAGPRR